METWLIFLGGMAICCAILIPLSILSDWLQKKLDEYNQWDDERREQQQLNNQEQ